MGDESGFLAAQADIGEWRRLQSIAFDQYRALGDRVDVTGEIRELDITAHQARVVLEEQLDGRHYHVLWFYEHNGGVWQHIPPSPDFWGKQTSSPTPHFDFTYYEEDAALAEALKVRMNGWWETSCQLTQCRAAIPPTQVRAAWLPRLRVRIEPDPLVRLGWASYDDNTLLIPSPLLGRVAADGSVDPVLLNSIASLLAERWASAIMERFAQAQIAPAPELAWLEGELAIWLHQAMSNAAPAHGFFGPLAETYGVGIVLDILLQAPSIAANDSIIPAVESATGAPALSLPVEWDGYLAYRLRSEAALIAQGHTVEATVLYRDPQREAPPFVLDVPLETLADPSTIEVISTRSVGELVWAEVRFAAGDNVRRIAFEPFRLADGRWVHTWAEIQDWGALHEDRSANFVLKYYDLDAFATQGLLPTLEQLYGVVSADYGLDPAENPSIRVTVTPTAANADSVSSIVRRPFPAEVGQSASEIQIIVPSAYVVIRADGVSVAEHVREVAARELASQLLIRRLEGFPANHPLAVAFLTWEAERIGLDANAVREFTIAEQGRIRPLWPEDGSGWLAFQTPYQDVDYLQARILLDVLVEQHGMQAVPLLLENLPTSANVDDWLSRSLGITHAAIQPAWQAAMLLAGQQP